MLITTLETKNSLWAYTIKTTHETNASSQITKLSIHQRSILNTLNTSLP